MKVFISYATQDEALADRVVSALQQASIDTWYDKQEIV
ncbi:MAG: TIR domain-containing protein, partial [Blastocatellia bacterium]